MSCSIRNHLKKTPFQLHIPMAALFFFFSCKNNTQRGILLLARGFSRTFPGAMWNTIKHELSAWIKM